MGSELLDSLLIYTTQETIPGDPIPTNLYHVYLANLITGVSREVGTVERWLFRGDIVIAKRQRGAISLVVSDGRQYQLYTLDLVEGTIEKINIFPFDVFDHAETADYIYLARSSFTGGDQVLRYDGTIETLDTVSTIATRFPSTFHLINNELYYLTRNTRTNSFNLQHYNEASDTSTVIQGLPGEQIYNLHLERDTIFLTNNDPATDSIYLYAYAGDESLERLFALGPITSTLVRHQLVAANRNRVVYTIDFNSTLISTDGTQEGETVLYTVSFDGLAAGPTLLKDGSYAVRLQNHPEGKELFRLNSALTQLEHLNDPTPGPGLDIYTQFITAPDSSVYLVAEGLATGNELYRVTADSVNLVADINTDDAGSNPLHFIQLTDRVVFTAESCGRYRAYQTDGTLAGTRLLFPEQSALENHVVASDMADGRAFTLRNYDAHGRGVWTSQIIYLPTAEGAFPTVAFDQIELGLASFATPPMLLGDELWVVGLDSLDQANVYVYSPPGGVELRYTFPEGTSFPENYGLRFAENKVLFANRAPGTFADRLQVMFSRDRQPRPVATFRDQSSLEVTTLQNGAAYFEVFNNGASELYVTNGTAAGTRPLAEVAQGFFGTNVESITPMGRYLLTATVTTNDRRYQLLDSRTNVVTRLAAPINFFPLADSGPAIVDGNIYLIGYDLNRDSRSAAYVIDRGAATLTRVSSPDEIIRAQRLAKVGDNVYLLAQPDNEQRYLYQIPTTTDEAERVGSVPSFGFSNQRDALAATNGRLVLQGYTTDAGYELFAFAPDGDLADGDPNAFSDACAVLPTNTETPTTANIGVYPNPASDYLSLLLTTEQPVEVELLDIMGRQVHNWTRVMNETQLSISDVQPGNYILRLVSEDGSWKQTARISVQR